MKEEKDVEIVNNAINDPHDASSSPCGQENVVEHKTDSNRSSWDENLSDLNNEGSEKDNQEENEHDTVSEET